MGYKTIAKQLGEKVTTVGTIIRKWKKHKRTVNLPLARGSMQDLTSWSCNDHENGEDLVNDVKAAGIIVTKKTIGNTLLQRRQGPPAQESTYTCPSEVCQ